ncbi:MAG: hypothetical protein LQ343_000529 [Gyalolechia ehrenbergii]|nr:MAG: hypothetical protein LQ343_000529 [Gyalolechia ehrenbergii]
MASGYGLSGAHNSTGPSRCFPFWQELLACYVVNTNTDDVTGAKKCVLALEDYYECLHHRKEVIFPDILRVQSVVQICQPVLRLVVFVQKARVEELQRAYRRAEASHPRENAPKAGTIRSLGLLNKDEDTKAVIGVDRSLDGGKGR